MDVAEWIIVSILSLTLFVFLILGIYVLLKVLDLTHDAKYLLRDLKHITKKGQHIVGKASTAVDDLTDKATSTADAVKDDVTATTGAVKTAVVSALEKRFVEPDNKTKKSK